MNRMPLLITGFLILEDDTPNPPQSKPPPSTEYTKHYRGLKFGMEALKTHFVGLFVRLSIRPPVHNNVLFIHLQKLISCF